jgi:Glycosyltransferase 61/Glycosyl transferase family 2
MTFAEEVGTYRFRLLGPRFRPAGDGRYRLPRPDGSVATVLESEQLVLEPNNVDLGAVEATLKAPLRDLAAITKTPALACGAIVSAAVRHMPRDLAFVSADVGDGFLFLAGMLGNDDKTCIGSGDFGEDESGREAFRAHFDARRSSHHSFFEGDYRDCLGGGGAPRIGVFLQGGDQSYEQQLEALRAAEPLFADDGLVVVLDANRDAPREATLEFARESRLPWRVVLDERTAGRHPTLWNGMMVLQAGADAPDAPVRLLTDTRLAGPLTVRNADSRRHPPELTVLHYRNPCVGVQDYPNLDVVGLNRGAGVRDAFERSTGSYVVVLDPDVELTPDALSEAVRMAEGGEPAVAHRPPRPPRRNGNGARRHEPLMQANYYPSWARTFDAGDGAQTVTVARGLSVVRDNLVALDLDPDLADTDREVAVRFANGLRLEGPPARCSRVPYGVVAGRVGAVLAPEGVWLIESVGSVTRAWPELALDGRGRVEVREPARESDERVATVACELRRAWWTGRFGHWTFEVLTRVAMLLRAGVPDDVKLLIPEPVLPFQRETLVGLGIAEDRILAWDGRPTRFRTVYVPTARPTPPFLFPAGVELLRELGAGVREATPSRRLFVSRRQLGLTTRIANEEELLEVAERFGFEEVMPETLPYREQVRLFSEASVVTGAHGSGLANAIFMDHGTGLCELAPARLHAEKVPNFWDLAACGRQRYGVCVARRRRVDPKRFKHVLRTVIASAASGELRSEHVAEAVGEPVRLTGHELS